MADKTIELSVLLFVVMLTLGCDRSDSRPVIEYDFREGTKGFGMEFVENAPPDELYESGNFLISADVSNEGAFDILSGVFALSIEELYMEVRDWNGYIITSRNPLENTAQFDIEGKSQNIPEGGKSRVTIRARTRLLDTQSETHTSAVLLTACYPYKTTLVEEVCIDPDVYGTKKSRNVCEVSSIALSSQGAPVAITKIDAIMLESEDYNTITPQFTLHLHNLGNGEVFDVDSVQEACSSSPLAREDINFVRVSAKLADKSLACTPQPVHLGRKENIVRCTLEPGYSKGSSSFLSPLVVELDYGYAFTISKTVVIRRLGT